MKGSFVADVFSAMEEQGINKSQLAERLGKSRQYVGRVLNETANITIDSIARIAASLQMDVVLRLKKPTEEVVIQPCSCGACSRLSERDTNPPSGVGF